MGFFHLDQANGRGDLGRKLLLTPRQPPEKPWKADCGYCDTASHKMLTLQALSSSLSMPALQREAAWAEERLLGDLWQSVPQNGHVHLHMGRVFSLMARFFLLAVGLCCLWELGLVFFTYGWNSVWYFLLTVEDRFGLFCLRFPPVRKSDLVFFTYGSPTASKKDEP